MFNKYIFAQRLTKLRNDTHLSMANLANAVGLKTAGAINQFEKGLNLPSIETLVAIADFFNVSVDYLLGRTDDPYCSLTKVISK